MEKFSIYLPTLIFMTFCGALWCLIYSFIIKAKIKENRMKKLINKKIIEGNKFASKLKRNGRIYIEDEDLIMAALEGNENAMKTLIPIDKHGID